MQQAVQVQQARQQIAHQHHEQKALHAEARQQQVDQRDAHNRIQRRITKGGELLPQPFQDAVHHALHIHKGHQRPQYRQIKTDLLALVQHQADLLCKLGEQAAGQKRKHQRDEHDTVDQMFQRRAPVLHMRLGDLRQQQRRKRGQK